MRFDYAPVDRSAQCDDTYYGSAKYDLTDVNIGEVCTEITEVTPT